MLPFLLASLVLGPVPLVWLARRWGPAPELTGFSALVPATTTAIGAAKDAFEFAVMAILLFAISRGIVFARERARAGSHAVSRRRAA